MNREMIRLWNASVTPLDTVYHIGDFAMGPAALIPEYRGALNGRIVLILGNHDRSATRMLASGFDEVHKELWIERESRHIWLRHIPPSTEEISKLSRPCDLVLNGHVHTDWLVKTKQGIPLINVGTDVWWYKPWPLSSLLAALNGARAWKARDQDDPHRPDS